MPFRIHLIDDMPRLEGNSLWASAHLDHRASERSFEPVKLASNVTLNFLAKSLNESSSVRPVIIPFIRGSASGDLFPC